MISEFNEEKETLSKKLSKIEEETNQAQEKKKPEQVFELIKSIVSFDTVSPLLIGQLIESIYIYKSNEIVINYKFCNPFD